jgi:hypothetical protein
LLSSCDNFFAINTAADAAGEQVVLSRQDRRPEQGTSPIAANVALVNSTSLRPPAQSERVALAVEMVGHAGAVAAIVAVIALPIMFWNRVSDEALIGVGTFVAVLLLIAGSGLPPGGRGARVGSGYWLSSVAATVSTLAIALTLYGHRDDGSGVAVAAALAVVAYAAALWWRRRLGLQAVAFFLSLQLPLEVHFHPWNWAVDSRWVVAGPWCIAAAWFASAAKGLVRPRRVGLATAAVGALAITLWGGLTSGSALALGLVTLAGVACAGVAMQEALLLGLSAVATAPLVWLAIARWMSHSPRGDVVVVVAGVVLSGAAALAVGSWATTE